MLQRQGRKVEICLSTVAAKCVLHIHVCTKLRTEFVETPGDFVRVSRLCVGMAWTLPIT